MNNYHLLTSNDNILRKFAKDRIEKNDLHKWKIIESSYQIPKEFEFVIELILSNQNLKEIPLNILYCKILYCGYNELTKLPNLPYCKQLYCSNNQLTELPNIPYCQELNCSKNQLTKLPNLPYCKELICYHNKLKHSPDLPNGIY